MAGFDIKTILNFDPPTFVCPACRGLFRSVDRKTRSGGALWDEEQSCPVCRSVFVSDDRDAPTHAPRWLRDNGHSINHGKDLLEYSRALAALLQTAEGSRWYEPWPRARLLLEVLTRARHFVHFTTYGISHVLIGALKMTSVRVPVYGFASNVESHARVELTEMSSEAPRLRAEVIPSSSAAQDVPHQKLIVVDGLLAFKGSANLTNTGLRKADRGLDIHEVVTDYEQVTALNNEFFAPVWKRITVGDGNHILMVEEPF